MADISLKDKAECAAREVKQRIRVYDRLVADGKMTPNKARREIEIMMAISEDYWILVEKDEPKLFGKRRQHA